MGSGIPEQFTNSVGTYHLLRAEKGRVAYRFLGRSGKTAEADVPVATWRRLASRAKDHGDGADGAVELQAA